MADHGRLLRATHDNYRVGRGSVCSDWTECGHDQFFNRGINGRHTALPGLTIVSTR